MLKKTKELKKIKTHDIDKNRHINQESQIESSETDSEKGNLKLFKKNKVTQVIW